MQTDTHGEADNHRRLRSASGRPLIAAQPYWLMMESTQAWGGGTCVPNISELGAGAELDPHNLKQDILHPGCDV